ncbi:acyl carrier protein [Nonomuraea sp. MG754425]|uniref:acyl carrier protein n=1 Tax=Nonomuraea sp. MG754425 TaxID=2570319 RepID=UPI001F397F76|nr:acyl carrier protein [Nonomuraea sp. MG754425]MCF6467973.1 acyl carrier protein [Nonomuraea sp. MG754425]
MTIDTPTTPMAAGPGGDRFRGTDDPMTRRVSEICGVIVIADLPPDDDLLSHGLTSIQIVRIIGALFREYRVSLDPVDVYDHPTARRLAALIRERTGHGTGD